MVLAKFDQRIDGIGVNHLPGKPIGCRALDDGEIGIPVRGKFQICLQLFPGRFYPDCVPCLVIILESQRLPQVPHYQAEHILGVKSQWPQSLKADRTANIRRWDRDEPAAGRRLCADILHHLCLVYESRVGAGDLTFREAFDRFKCEIRYGVLEGGWEAECAEYQDKDPPDRESQPPRYFQPRFFRSIFPPDRHRPEDEDLQQGNQVAEPAGDLDQHRQNPQAEFQLLFQGAETEANEQDTPQPGQDHL